jgi:hypothetical protein
MRSFGVTLGGVLVVLITWHLCLAGAITLAGKGDASLDQGRVFPYNHSHLGEEAAAGAYSPLTDPLFVLWAIVRNFIAFALSSALTGRLATRPKLVAGSSLSLGLIAIYMIHFHLVFPRPAGAFALEVVVAVVGAYVGYIVGTALVRRAARRAELGAT